MPPEFLNAKAASIQPALHEQLKRFGARDMDLCMQCGVCSASCPLSSGPDAFPRSVYRSIQLGLEDRLRQSTAPWLCYYCGDCNLDCPRGAEPAETMMAARRWLTAHYDWTGLAKRFYLSAAWEISALLAVALLVILLFWFGHGPVITDRVAVNSFAPVVWIEIGDLIMAGVLSLFLLSNGLRMFRLVMGDMSVPLALYIKEAKQLGLHFLTQKRWRECGEDRRRWLKHLILVSGYLTMMTLVIGFIRWFQVDDRHWHFSSLFGYYATGAILLITIEMAISRRRQKEAMHRFSELSDWLFLALLFLTTFSGILMHVVRLAGWPMGTYVLYVVHLAIAVPMLVVEVPFGKWSHLFYRPLAIFLSAVRQRAVTPSLATRQSVMHSVGNAFLNCLQCGACVSLCPASSVSKINPRRILRDIALNRGSDRSVDRAAWYCLTCRHCSMDCPSGIDIIEELKAVRQLTCDTRHMPAALKQVLDNLKTSGNPWIERTGRPIASPAAVDLPPADAECDYAFFPCCTTMADPRHLEAAAAAIQLLTSAGIALGRLGTATNCCGHPARVLGDAQLADRLLQKHCDGFAETGVTDIVLTSPHCLTSFSHYVANAAPRFAFIHYSQLLERLLAKGHIHPSADVRGTVTYHDPCYLGRHNGIYETPRNILKRIPGLTVIEMPRNRENALCCGGGGGNVWQPAGKNNPLGMMRVHEALASGADIIATACPLCRHMLQNAVTMLKISDRIQVRDVAQLLLQSMPDRTHAMQTHASDRLQEVCHG